MRNEYILQRDISNMMTELDRKAHIKSVADEWACSVIGFGSKELSALMDQEENKFMMDMDKRDIIIFMKIYLERVLNAYDIQLRSLASSMTIEIVKDPI